MTNFSLLKDQIDVHSRSIKTDKLSFSINELCSLYKSGKILINPDFQRLFRWGKIQKSKLIESILLRLPIPPIFVSENSEGKYELIDGLQRLSTIFEFLGILKEDKLPFVAEKQISQGLLSGQYLISLQGIKWEDFDDITKNRFLFYRIDTNVIFENDLSPLAKYDLFDRLNSLSSQASNQEVRNALLIMGDKTFFEWLQNLSLHQSFNLLVTEALPEKDVEQSFHMEMILRFFAVKAYKPEIDGNISNIGEFITLNARLFLQPDKFNREKEEELFKKTFDIIQRTMGEQNAFRRVENGKSGGRFVLPAFDVIAPGIAYNMQGGTLIEESHLESVISSIWTAERYESELGSKSGVSSEKKIKNATLYGREIFKKQD